jgi:hypothetical protein
MKLAAVVPPPKRLLTRTEAAGYCGMSLTTFDSVCPVRPIAFGSDRRLKRYDVQALNLWIDRLSLPAPASKTKEQALAELDNDDYGPRTRR